MTQVPPTTPQRVAAEFLGTFVLVFGGCGSAVLAATFVSGDNAQLGIGFVGISLAFGLTVLTMTYAVGHVSGGHFNPAVTLGLAAGGRFAWKDTAGYVVTQVVAAIAAAAVLFVILGVVDTRAPKGFAPIAIGLALTLIHLVSIPVTGTSVNPARSIGPALFAGSAAIEQLWLFILAPVLGALVAGFSYAFLLGESEPAAPLEEATAG